MRGLGLVVALLLGLALAAPRAGAQVVLDGSLGGPTGLVPGGASPDGSSATYLIEESYGRRSEANLFHSFSRFDVPAAQSAAFTGDPSIDRVIARVTSGPLSQIGGSVRNTIEGADLYLFNPRGFFFSGSASLDLRGSLYVSSADQVRFDDGEIYSAIPTGGEVLSAEAPSAWGFTAAIAPATIRFNQVRNFGVPAGETLEVVGGSVIVSGLSPSTTLSAPGGTIALASRATAGEVPVGVATLAAREAESTELGNVNLGTNAVLDVSDPASLSPERGRIVIRAGALTVDSSVLRVDSSADALDGEPDIDVETTRSITLRRSNPLLRATSLEASARGGARGGGVRLSSETVTLSSASSATSIASDTALAGPLDVDAGELQVSEIARLATSATGNATAGRVDVDARTAALTFGAQISSVNGASTDAPDVAIRVEEILELGSAASVVTQAGAGGRGATARIAAASLEQSTGARIESGTEGPGRGGDIELDAAQVRFDGDPTGADPGGLFARSFGLGDAGDVSIAADEVNVAGGAQVSATAEGAGRGGDVGIAASLSVALSGASALGPSGVFARSGLAPGTGATGDGGGIAIDAPLITVGDGAEISTQTFGTGGAGGIRLTAENRVEIAGGASARSSINAKAAIGMGGDIAIETAELRVDEGGEISASTLGTGNSGDVRIEAERVFVGGGAASAAGPAGVFAQSIPTEDTGIVGGDGGDIEIGAEELVQIANGGVVSAQTRGAGAAGSVRIEAPVVRVSDGGEVSVQTFGSGSAGGVSIVGPGTVDVTNGEISARSEGAGAAGSVTLDVGSLFVGSGGSITTETLADGPGGSIEIDAVSQVFVANGGTISARSAGAGNAGSIDIAAGGRFSARNGGQVTTSAALADGGDIAIRASHLIYVNHGHVTTNVQGGLGKGGNITMDPEFVVLKNHEIRASATGDGGDITIRGDHIVIDNVGIIDASSELGIDGEVLITSPTVDLTSELAQLDTTFLDASSKLAAACAARAGERGTFAVRGRARPSSPDAPLGSSDESERAPGCDEPQP